MRYIIQPNGFAKLTLKVPYDKVKTLRKGFVVPKGSKLSDGLLGLAGVISMSVMLIFEMVHSRSFWKTMVSLQ